MPSKVNSKAFPWKFFLLFTSAFIACAIASAILSNPCLKISFPIRDQIPMIVVTSSASLTGIMIVVLGILFNIFREQGLETPSYKTFRQLIITSSFLLIYASLTSIMSFAYLVDNHRLLYIFSVLLFVTLLLLIMSTILWVVRNILKSY